MLHDGQFLRVCNLIVLYRILLKPSIILKKKTSTVYMHGKVQIIKGKSVDLFAFKSYVLDNRQKLMET
jgi:hypothetical protein